MRLKVSTVVLSLLAAWLACAADHAARLDGRSDAAFKLSHELLVRSLTDPEKVELVLAEQIIQAAATPTADRRSDPSKAKLTPLLSIRSELNGLNFVEIVALSRTKKARVKVGFVTDPSN